MLIIHAFPDDSVGLSDLHDDNYLALGDGVSATRLKEVLDSAISLTNKEVANKVREVFSNTPHGEEFAQFIEQGSVIPTAKIYRVGEGWSTEATDENRAAADDLAKKLVGADA